MDESVKDLYDDPTDDYNADDLDCAVCADVLVDPCTLGCGHNFCELCLAKVWREKRGHSNRDVSMDTIECPFCRQPWYRYPEINGKLRNIVNKKYAGVVTAKQDEYQADEKKTLQLFRQAKSHRPLPTTAGNRVFRRAGRRPINSTMALLLLLLILAIGALLLGLLIYVLIISGEGVSGYVFKPVHQWDTHDVSDWVSSIAPFARDTVSELVLKEGINGAHLLELSDDDLLELGVTMTTRRRTLLLAIAELKDVGFLVPKSFNGFKEKYFQETVSTTFLYVMWPRHTLLMLYLTNYHLMFVPLLRFHFPEKAVEEQQQQQQQQDVSDLTAASSTANLPGPGQLMAFFLLVLISPHYLMLSFAWSWHEMEPYISFAVCLHALTAMLYDVKACYKWYINQPSNFSVKFMNALWTTFNSTVTQFVPAVLVSRVVWYFLPNLIWSGLLYAVIFFTPCKLCFSLLSSLLFRRNNVNINVEAGWNVR